MVQHEEAWQVFDAVGNALQGSSISPSKSREDSTIIVGAVHVWIWRRSPHGIEVLLQHRAVDKPTWPDHWDISVAGHIDAGETLVDALKRESLEEVGVEINIQSLNYIFSYRNFDNGIKWVYLSEQTEDIEYHYTDGEVQDVRWVSFEELERMIKSPTEVSRLVPHPQEYFSFLLNALKSCL